jgi:hypothetical protein
VHTAVAHRRAPRHCRHTARQPKATPLPVGHVRRIGHRHAPDAVSSILDRFIWNVELSQSKMAFLPTKYAGSIMPARRRSKTHGVRASEVSGLVGGAALRRCAVGGWASLAHCAGSPQRSCSNAGTALQPNPRTCSAKVPAAAACTAPRPDAQRGWPFLRCPTAAPKAHFTTRTDVGARHPALSLVMLSADEDAQLRGFVSGLMGRRAPSHGADVANVKTKCRRWLAGRGLEPEWRVPVFVRAGREERLQRMAVL